MRAAQRRPAVDGVSVTLSEATKGYGVSLHSFF